MNVSVIGISFHTAPVGLRGRVAISDSDMPARLQGLHEAFPGAEWVLVSTCNRTEFYAAGIDAAAVKGRLAPLLFTGALPLAATAIDKHVYVHHGLDAVEHLLAVASGLDALVVGETEVLGQVKRAFGIAQACRTTGRVLGPLFQQAFKIAKRVHSQTGLGRGRMSVSSLAVAFAEQVFADLHAKTVMIVGAGETAGRALKSLMDRGVREVLVLNRSLARSRALAERCGGRAIPFDALDAHLPQVDIVISSTSAPHLVIKAAAVRRALAVRRDRPMLLIDLAVPRDIDPAAGRIPNASLYSLDDLQRIAATNLARRREAVDQAWQIVRQGTADIAALSASGCVRQVLRKVDDHGREICERAVRHALARKGLATLPEAGREEIRQLAERIVRKLLAEPRSALKRAVRSGEWEAYARIANDLFGLDRRARPGCEPPPVAARPPAVFKRAGAASLDSPSSIGERPGPL